MSWLGLDGHDALVDRFRRAIARGRLGSTFLFVGPEGVGKFSFALRLAQSLLCPQRPAADLAPCGECPTCRQVLAESHGDLYLVRRSPDRMTIPIEALIGPRERRMREGLCAWMALKPTSGMRKIAIIDDADLLGVEAANSLLKTLEEPPPHAVLILVGTNPSRQLPTIRSRCQIIRFHGLAPDVVAAHIRTKGLVPADQDVDWLTRMSLGSLAVAARYADPVVRAFREAWCRTLADPEVDPIAQCNLAMKYVDAGESQGVAKRDRLRFVLELAVDLYRQLLWACYDLPLDADPPFAEAAARMARRAGLDAETVVQCLDRSLDALRQVDASGNPRTVLEAWLDDVSRIRREGPHSPAATPLSA